MGISLIYRKHGDEDASTSYSVPSAKEASHYRETEHSTPFHTSQQYRPVLGYKEMAHMQRLPI